jgi:hypothetical protein
MKKTLKKIAFLLLFVSVAVASTAGPNSAGTITGAAWTSPSNAATTNGVYATQNIPALSVSGQLVFSAYGFGIPAGSTVNGIQVDIVRHANSIASLNFGGAEGGTGVFLTKTVGVQAGTAKNDGTSWGTTDATTTLGSGADLWGTTWTAAEVNASGFGVVIQVDNDNASLSRTASVDSVLVTVNFTAPPGMGKRVIRSGMIIKPAKKAG